MSERNIKYNPSTFGRGVDRFPTIASVASTSKY